MSYLDPKERVIDLQLTSYGKYLLSIGKLQPTHYAFFDDDIIYDGTYADVGENQSQIEPRIQEETPRFSAQAVFSARELEIFNQNPNIINDLIIGQDLENLKEEDKQKILQKVKIQDGPEHSEVLLHPLGTTNTAYEYAPAWNAAFLKAPLSSSATYLITSGTRGESYHAIPQLDVEIKYRIEKFSKAAVLEDSLQPDENGYDGEVAVSEAASSMYISDTIFFEDGSKIDLKSDALILQIEESNTFFKKDNFDIEVFEIETVNKKENLIPLKFYNDKDLLVKDTEKEVFEKGTVQKYFRFQMDKEIPLSNICPLIKESKKKQVFTSNIFNCIEVDFNKEEGELEDRNLYLMEEEEDICE
tara:strand:- start:701 stop:1777 length:1077 start_codon:yes stop_codon:yes gene_type:complete